MSMVVFPFKSEDAAQAGSNLSVAAHHRRVSRVLAVGASDNATFSALGSAAGDIARASGTPVEVIVQDRWGARRPGKGDGINTGLCRFLDSDEQRLHFYDADIYNFAPAWIDGAERAADRGFGIVRHYFPRASTDAMITSMITRPGFALTHPRSILWQIHQPLGGEFLIRRDVAQTLWEDRMVRQWSDWGIDTVLTFAMASTGLPIYEHYVAAGKQHALYGSLEDLREMVVECFEAVLHLAGLPSPDPVDHQVEPGSRPPAEITETVAFDPEATLHALATPWSGAEVRAAAALPDSIATPLRANVARPSFSFLDAERWYRVLEALLERYQPNQPGWAGVLFRLWTARVLAYTTSTALAGHERAMLMLDRTVEDYARRAGNRQA